MAEAAREKSAPQRAMERLGLRRDIDLVLHLPLRYEDETTLQPMAQLRDGETVQAEGVVREQRVDQRRRRQLLIWLDDGSGELVLRFLHFYPSQQKSWAVGQRLRVRGEVRVGFFGREMVHPTVKLVEEGAPLAQALTPVYPSVAALPQPYLRKAIASALQRAVLEEVLPPPAVPPGLPALGSALRLLHQPPREVPPATLEDRSHPAWQRLKYEELLAQQLAQAEAQRERSRQRAPALAAAGVAAAPGSLHARLMQALPFALTAAQARVGREIDADLAREYPMNRLLQGDVGSGKTVVAALAAARAIDAGWQCALMAPTEILAEQHFRKLVQWLDPLGVQVAWLSGSRKGKARTAAIQAVAEGRAALVVGTHAVIQDDVRFARLGLAIVDEQHRFGVAQRLALRDKLRQSSVGANAAAGPDAAAGRAAPSPAAPSTGAAGAAAALDPHLLMMSATPIPRTLAMTYFADLDVSTIDELPPGRTPVLTKVFADTRRDEVVARMHEAIAAGRQVYWVCPLIEEREEAADPAPSRAADAPPRQTLDLQNVKDTHARLSAALPDCAIGLLHGRMPAAEKAAVMSLFVSGDLKVLVATTVIEVGVDVPNASLMVIEHAERFGLSQLHQLRGRVGRGAAASVCVLLYAGPLSETGKSRLQAMAQTNDGFEIARRDLEIRGPGEFIGARQSGDALLRFADLQDDAPLLAFARRTAPTLWAEHPGAARAHVARWLGGKLDYLKA